LLERSDILLPVWQGLELSEKGVAVWSEEDGQSVATDETSTLIPSGKGEGTAVYNRSGAQRSTIKRARSSAQSTLS
jgi:hypothetical protein